jgi:hypothetical protein
MGLNMPMIRKEVSLDLETWKIADNMDNFSQWVRIGLRNEGNGVDLATETRLRIRWAKAAHLLASALIEYAQKVDPEYSEDVQTIVAKAMNQTTLEEY